MTEGQIVERWGNLFSFKLSSDWNPLLTMNVIEFLLGLQILNRDEYRMTWRDINPGEILLLWDLVPYKHFGISLVLTQQVSSST